MPLYNTACLFSTVKNELPVPRHFAFLPPHGRTLDPNEEYTVFGHITEAVISHGDRATSRRNMGAFEEAVQRGDISIVNTPAPIVANATAGQPSKMLKVTGGTLSAVDPCWSVSVTENEFEAF